MKIQENLAAIMCALKKQSGKSTSEFSEELEISRSSLQEYLTGTGNPSIATIEHLSKKLNVDPSCLVSSAFSTVQIDILFLLLDTWTALSELTAKQRRRFAELMTEIIALWGEDEHAGK